MVGLWAGSFGFSWNMGSWTRLWEFGVSKYRGGYLGSHWQCEVAWFRLGELAFGLSPCFCRRGQAFVVTGRLQSVVDVFSPFMVIRLFHRELDEMETSPLKLFGLQTTFLNLLVMGRRC
jgi:hypothetical protein